MPVLGDVVLLLVAEAAVVRGVVPERDEVVVLVLVGVVVVTC